MNSAAAVHFRALHPPRFSAMSLSVHPVLSAMVCLRHGAFMPIPFSSMLDPLTGRTRVRLVDTSAGSYDSARRYMVRLSDDDLNDDHAMVLYARAAGMTVTAFRERFRALGRCDGRQTRVSVS